MFHALQSEPCPQRPRSYVMKAMLPHVRLLFLTVVSPSRLNHVGPSHLYLQQDRGRVPGIRVYDPPNSARKSIVLK